MINQAPIAVVKVATQFLQELAPDVAWHNMPFGGIDREDLPVANAVVGAFWLYSLEWGAGFKIANWKYPFDELRRGGDFAGSEPWAVLFQFALAASKEHA